MGSPKKADMIVGPDGLRANQRRFLKCFAQCGTVAHAAKAAKVEKGCHGAWKKGDNAEIYLAAFEEAQQEAADNLEREAIRRAVEGVQVRKFHPKTGKQYYENHYSDTLLIFLMKGARPEKYKEAKSVVIKGGVGNSRVTNQINEIRQQYMEIDVSKLSLEEAEILMKAIGQAKEVTPETLSLPGPVIDLAKSTEPPDEEQPS